MRCCVFSLEESGVITDCSIKTQEVDDILDFTFDNLSITCKVILAAELLKDVLNDLDTSSDVVEISLTQTNFRISTYGNAGSVHVSLPHAKKILSLCTISYADLFFQSWFVT